MPSTTVLAALVAVEDCPPDPAAITPLVAAVALVAVVVVTAIAVDHYRAGDALPIALLFGGLACLLIIVAALAVMS